MNTQNSTKTKKPLLTVWEIVLFPLLGSLMYISYLVMQFLPNIHLLGLLIMVYTLVFRVKAIIPIYVYVFLSGILGGFSLWWLPYLYIWTILWAVTLLLPKGLINKKIGYVIYPAVCFMHGILFGALYAPAQALMFGLDFNQTIAWIIAGLPFDAIHGVSNLVLGTFIIPLTLLLKKILKNIIA